MRAGPSLVQAPSPRAAHQRRPSAGALTTPTTAAPRTVSAISEPHTPRPREKFLVPSIGSSTQARSARPSSPPRSSPTTGRPGARRDQRPQRVLGGQVGVGDRGPVRLAVHPQVGGPEAGQGDRVGGVGEAQSEIQIGVHATSIPALPGTGPRLIRMTMVLLAEDDTAIAEPLSRALQREGYQVDVAADGMAALERIRHGQVDLLVLDLGLPGMDGLEVCRRIRPDHPELPVLMLTARTDEVDFVVGLDAGADDYVGKPFRLAELLARVRALLRRLTPDSVEVGGVRMELSGRRVLVDGAEVALANKEFELLRVLLLRAGQVVTREEILREVWNDPEMKTSKTLDMHMSWLRRKIGGERRIATVRGVGFRFNHA